MESVTSLCKCFNVVKAAHSFTAAAFQEASAAVARVCGHTLLDSSRAGVQGRPAPPPALQQQQQQSEEELLVVCSTRRVLSPRPCCALFFDLQMKARAQQRALIKCPLNMGVLNLVACVTCYCNHAMQGPCGKYIWDAVQYRHRLVTAMRATTKHRLADCGQAPKGSCNWGARG